MITDKETRTVSLNKMKLGNITIGDKVAIIGMSGSGKTVILKAIMKRFENIPACIVVSETEEGNNNFKDIVPDSYIFEAWSPDLETKIANRQKHAMSKLTQEEKEASLRGEITKASLLFIMDDCGWNSDKWGKSALMKKFFMNGRQWGLIIIITVQDPMDFKSKLRTQLNWIFLLKEKNFDNRQKLHKHYAGVVNSFEIFDGIMRGCTIDYACLVLNNKSISYELNENLFWYKAPIYAPFKIGSEKYKKQHARKYNPKYGEENQVDEYNSKSKLKLKIIKTIPDENDLKES